MAGLTKSAETTTAPVTATSGPSPTSPATGNPSSASTPAEAAPKRGPGRPPKNRTEQASSPAPASVSPQKAATPAKKAAPSGPEPTYFKTEADLDEALAEFAKGEPAKDDPKGTKEKDATEGKPTEEHDAIQDELDEEEKAAKAAGLPVKKPEEAEKSEEKPDDEAEAPEADDNKEAYEAWLKTLSKGAREKIQRLEKQKRELKAKEAERIEFQTVPDEPFAHVHTHQQLEAERTTLEKIRDATELDENSEGCEIINLNGKKVVLENADQVKEWRDWSREVLKIVIPQVESRVKTRIENRPWEAAAKLVPDLFEKGSFANKVASEVFQKRLSSFADYEVKVAHMARSMQMDEDQKPTKDYPKGKAKWVRLELDGEGNVVLPKKAVKAAPNAKPVTEQAPKTSPSTAKPAVKSTAGGKGDLDEALQRAEKSRDPDDLDAAYRAFERAA